MNDETKPSLLVSFHYRSEWSRVSHLNYWREVVLDSGAFSAAKGGISIDIVELGDWIEAERARAPGIVTEAFTLDVIGGSWKDSLKNTETLWKRGIDVIPVFHVGEPTDVLVSLARDYPKVALGGAVGYRAKMEWAALCFKHVWPKKLHGLGFGQESVMKLPFHTVDHSSWYFAPSAFGQYPSMGNLPTRNTKRLWLHSEVQYQLHMEKQARRLWQGRLPADWDAAPSIRLATSAYEKEIRSLSPIRLAPDLELKDFPLAGETT